MLEKAALLRNDESILVHIRGRDCVAIEARYHNRCYKNYVKCLDRKPTYIGPTLYDEAFERFCVEFIEKRVIKKNEILFLSYLLKKFVACVQSIDKVEVPYQAARLKKRIQMRYPQIVFHKSKTMNRGTLVYVDSVTAGQVADEFIVSPHGESDTEDKSNDDDDTDECLANKEDQPFNQTAVTNLDGSLKQLFYAAIEIRELLKESNGVDSWPPDSHDLTLELATNSIPVKLYNFLAWCLGFSSEPVADEMVEITTSEKTKVVSIAQDLIYAESRGKKQTHKSLALGMTVRQITGSVRLLKILHGLGHTVSASTVYKHDTALALASTKGQEIIIPRNMKSEVFTTIVWDNNDFNEETLSGKGTTHVTNGIIIQNEANVNQQLTEKISISRKHRTIQPPETRVAPYKSRDKGVISLESYCSEISLEEFHGTEQSLARNIDFVYVCNKTYASDCGKSLPGWTGFNTQIYKDIPPVSTIGYLPVVDAPVTDIATVNTILHHSVSICERLRLPEIVIVFDEAIYSKAQMIRWKEEELKRRLVIRLGEFHTIMSFCSAIAKIFKDAGLQVSFNFICQGPVV